MLQGKIAEEITDAGDGKGFVGGGLVSERSGLEILAGNFGGDVNLESGGGG
jgi:hypothetical protein